jgi:cytosine/adenosine deaminase-related metal-dependent hydrolase
MAITHIKQAELAVTYDAEADDHTYRPECDIVFDHDRIIHIGPGYDGEAEVTFDGLGMLVMPGLVNVHSHPSSEPGNKGITDEVGSKQLYNSSLYEYLTLALVDAVGVPHVNKVAWSELLMSGVTTLVDLSVANEGWVERAAQSGLRLVLAPMFRNGPWFTENGYRVEYDLDEAAGRQAMDAALAIVDAAVAHPCGRLSGMVAPSQIDTCTETLLRDAVAAAAERDAPIQIHCAQSITEFQEIVRRTGLTAVQWLDQLGYLGPRASIGHGIFLDHHPWVRWPTRTDMGRLADTGTSVAHCPTVFSRRGITLRDLGSYLRAGINVGIGTDTFPHNMLEEMRTAAICARITAETPHTIASGDLVRCATLGGAKLLGRDDIGRLAVGAKPDVVMVDLAHPMMQPGYDPLRSLIYAAAERAVKHVFVAGAQVVKDGKVLTMDYAQAAAAVGQCQTRRIAGVASRDWAGRGIEDLAPPTFRQLGRNI